MTSGDIDVLLPTLEIDHASILSAPIMPFKAEFGRTSVRKSASRPVFDA
jgi:hypothetical protein